MSITMQPGDLVRLENAGPNQHLVGCIGEVVADGSDPQFASVRLFGGMFFVSVTTLWRKAKLTVFKKGDTVNYIRSPSEQVRCKIINIKRNLL